MHIFRLISGRVSNNTCRFIQKVPILSPSSITDLQYSGYGPPVLCLLNAMATFTRSPLYESDM